MKVAHLVMAFAIVMGMVVTVLAVTGTPQYSLYQFRTAVEAHDAETARRYLDVESVVDSMIDGVTDTGGSSGSRSAWEEMGRNFTGGFMALAAPAMKESMRKQLRIALNRPSEDTTVIRKITTTRLREFEVKREGTMAFVTVRDDPRVLFRMHKSGGSWRIVQIMMDSLVYYPVAKGNPSS
jgi:hypothetical protein